MTDITNWDEPPRRRRYWPLPRLNQPFLLLLLFLIVIGSIGIGLWGYFFHHVPSGHMLVVITKTGTHLPEDEVLAGPGQKGIQAAVRGEGWHFIPPVLYETEVKRNVTVPGRTWTEDGFVPPKVGIVKSLGGEPLPPSEFLAEKGQQGLWREVLLPGTYRMNPYGYEIKLVDMIEIKQGFVGVLRRKLGVDGPTEFAMKPTEKGIIRDKVLHPGLYPINTEEFDVIPCEVGIYQTTYHYSTNPSENTALVFDASDSNRIQLDCTIEWELKPQYWPEWLSKFRNMNRVESTVIMPNVKNISRNKGQNYGAEDFLDGVKREQFQADFTRVLSEACAEDNVVVRNAFIRNIIISDQFLRPKREEQLAKEKAVTQKEQRLTAETHNEVVAAERTITLEVAKVEATTSKLVAAIDREAQNVSIITDAEIEKMKDEYSARISIIAAETEELLGKAKAEQRELIETAQSELFKMMLGVFNNDSDAFMRYTMSENLRPELRLRLFQSGPGTLWTNMGERNMNMFMPVPSGER